MPENSKVNPKFAVVAAVKYIKVFIVAPFQWTYRLSMAVVQTVRTLKTPKDDTHRESPTAFTRSPVSRTPTPTPVVSSASGEPGQVPIPKDIPSPGPRSPVHQGPQGDFVPLSPLADSLRRSDSLLRSDSLRRSDRRAPQATQPLASNESSESLADLTGIRPHPAHRPRNPSEDAPAREVTPSPFVSADLLSPRENDGWVPSDPQHSDVLFHAPLFERGVALFMPSTVKREGPALEFTTFKWGSRTLRFGETLLKNTFQGVLSKYAGINGKVSDDTGLRQTLNNVSRREESFVATFLPRPPSQSGRSRDIGLYTHMWSSGPLKVEGFEEKFSGFSKFVTAMCMFGASLQGVTNKETQRPLIKHEIQFSSDEQVIEVCTTEKSPYETYALREFMNFCHMAKMYAEKDKKCSVVCHLPWVDYMFFGFELYLKRRITVEALGQYFREILKKAKELTQLIAQVGVDLGIEIETLSPLENLFGLETSSLFKLTDVELANAMLEAFGIAGKASTDPEEQAINERNFVHRCLIQLRTNSIKSKQAEVWQAFVTSQKDRDLLAVAELTQQISIVSADIKTRETDLNGLLSQKDSYSVKDKDEKSKQYFSQLRTQNKELKALNDDKLAKQTELMRLKEKISFYDECDTFKLEEDIQALQSAIKTLTDKLAALDLKEVSQQPTDSPEVKVLELQEQQLDRHERMRDELRENIVQAKANLKNKEDARNYTMPSLLIGTDKDKGVLETIEGLFDVSNAVAVAYAARHRPDNKVCSILPLSEKPIQLKYQAFTARSDFPPTSGFPRVFCITVMDGMTGLGLPANRSGLLFYAQNNWGTLSHFARDGLNTARRNIGWLAKYPPNVASMHVSRLQQPPSFRR